MDLHRVETYLRPGALAEVPDWQPTWAWLAGGTWMFTEPQPQVTTLVDMQGLGWSELVVSPEGLTIGATCTMSRLLEATFPAEWSAVKALQSAVHELASFKVQNVATIGGNLCLALPAGTFAPALVALAATYELIALDGSVRSVPAASFQTGAKQTILQPGELLRKIWIPAEHLTWRVNYRRICIATAGLAVSIVVAAYHPQTQAVRVGIGAAVPAAVELAFDHPPSPEELASELDAQVAESAFYQDGQASAAYRRHVTLVMIGRAIQEAMAFGSG